MRSRYSFMSLAFATLLVAADSTYAGSPVSHLREEQLPHACQGGPKEGEACTADTQCPRSRCEINFLRGPHTAFEAKVTLIVDDNVSKFDGAEEISDVVAATVLLEIKHKGKTHMLAQTYQNLEGHTFDALTAALQAGPLLADTASPVSNRRAAELRLFEALTDDPFPSLVDDFLFEEGDNE